MEPISEPGGLTHPTLPECALSAAGIATRYRQRPLVHFTDVRFLATPALPVENETSYGLEAALIRGH